MNLHFAAMQARVLGDDERAIELTRRMEDLPTPVMNLCGDDEAMRLCADLISNPPTGGSGQTRVAIAQARMNFAIQRQQEAVLVNADHSAPTIKPSVAEAMAEALAEQDRLRQAGDPPVARMGRSTPDK